MSEQNAVDAPVPTHGDAMGAQGTVPAPPTVDSDPSVVAEGTLGAVPEADAVMGVADESVAGGADAEPEGVVDLTEGVEPEGVAEPEVAAGPFAVEEEGDDAAASADDRAEGVSGRRSRRQVLEREGEVAADFLETLLDIADLDGDIDLDIDGDRAVVSIVDSDEGRVPRRLVGTEGKVVDALQELARLAVQSATGERSRLMLDVAGYRAERRAALVEIARKAISEARTSGTEQSLEPMTSFERKVVHDEVLASGLSSESSGQEPYRYVVIIPS